ncbi:MAG: hypothetical protein GY861_11405 [bacterium]|nr:hypothetical protein [bacterium]
MPKNKPKEEKSTLDKIVDTFKGNADQVDDTDFKASASVEVDESQDLQSGEFVTKTELNSFGDKIIHTMSNLFKQQTEVHHDLAGQAPPIGGHELGQDTRGIEPVAASDLIKFAELEEFMNDILTINVHPTSDKEQNPVIIPSVNGVNQPIIRGRDCRVKRKFVEALARNRHTGYEQSVPDVTKPHKYVMVPSMVIKDPFVVKHDPHSRGSEWLSRIVNEA